MGQALAIAKPDAGRVLTQALVEAAARLGHLLTHLETGLPSAAVTPTLGGAGWLLNLTKKHSRSSRALSRVREPSARPRS